MPCYVFVSFLSPMEIVCPMCHVLKCATFWPGFNGGCTMAGGNMVVACCWDNGRVILGRGVKMYMFTAQIVPRDWCKRPYDSLIRPVTAPFRLPFRFYFCV